MFELKGYQRRGLDVLEAYLADVADGVDPAAAFQRHAPTSSYLAVPDLPKIPYVCLRVPTGGGKTLMASHAVGVAARTYLGRDHALCLWLVPSNTIREQTLNALRTRGHPYREALEEYFDGRLRVMDMEEALSVQRSTLDGETVVIVSTLAAHRVGDTDIRKVYETSGTLQHHFTGLTPRQLALLDKSEDGTYPYSLANVFRLRGPIVIMDEAHRARTSLSFDTLARFRPSCIVEFTATPETDNDPKHGRYRSNVLYHVSIKELKDADMVKLPIRLRTHPDWKQVVADAVAMTNKLRDHALKEQKLTGEYLRPITLFQAQPTYKDKESITVEKVKKCLLEDCHVMEAEIAVQTGQVRDLEGKNLSAPDCPIRFVITIEALREGWDCPFGYVLCTASEVRETSAVEQLLGRVLRLPGARRKQIDALNAAYAYVVSEHFLEAAGRLEEGLVDGLGFNPYEAGGAILPDTDTPSLFGENAPPAGVLRFNVRKEPNLSKLPPDFRKKVTFDPGTSQVVVMEPMDASQLSSLKESLGTDSDRLELGAALLRLEPREAFRIPLLGLKNRHGQMELFDRDSVVLVPWNPANEKTSLDERQFPDREPLPEAGEINTTDAGRVVHRQYQSADEARPLLVDQETGWTLEMLANWLARQRLRPNLVPGQTSLFCAKAVQFLIDQRHFTQASLIRRRFALARAIHRRLDESQSQHNRQAWQMLLNGCDFGRAETDPKALLMTLQETDYQPSRLYRGGWTPDKHYFRNVIGELNDEELTCAQYLDRHPAVKYWLRNLVRDAKAFRLPTSTDYFYPDFVCLLNDGRVLGVEYKGRQFEESVDTKEKDLVGRLWAERSGGRCLFAMTVGQDFKNIDAVIQVAAEKKEWILHLVSRNKSRPFETHLPVYTLKAAAGKFSESQDVAEEGWVLVDSHKLDSQMFVAQVIGKSMEPQIPDGSYCIFRFNPVGSRQGKTVLVEYRGPADPDTGGSYTVKRYRSKKEHAPDETPANVEITLEPINPAYQPLVLHSTDAADVQVRAVWMGVLK